MADDEDLVAAMDDLISRNKDLEPFRQQYLELKKIIENIATNLVGKEREYESYNHELNALRDQISFSQRNIEEIKSNQEYITGTTNNIMSVKTSLADSEKSNRDKIFIYTGNFEEMKAALSVGADWKPDQLEQKQVLEKERDFLVSKLDNKKNQLNGIRSDIERIVDTIQSTESNIEKVTKSITETDKEIKKLSGEIVEKKRHKDETEAKLFHLRSSVVSLEEELTRRKSLQQNDDVEMGQLELMVTQTRDKMDQYTKDYDNLVRLLAETTSELEKQKQISKKIQSEIDERKQYIDEKQVDVKLLTKEMKKIDKVKEVAAEKCIDADKERVVAETKRDEIEEKTEAIRRIDFINVRKEIESLEKQIAKVKAEMDIVRKKQVGSEKVSKQMADLIQLNINGKRNLNNEKKLIEEDIEEQKNQIRIVLLEKERYEHDVEVTNQQYYTALEELKLQELQIQELQKKINEDQAKLKYKQNLYEAVRSDRNLYSKQLSDAQDEIGHLKRKFRNINNRIEQLKDEVGMKDHAIVKEHFLHHSVDKERELLKNELTKIRKQVHSSEGIIDNQRVEVLKLVKIIEEADLERHRQRNELTAVLSERNLLTSQIVKRNFELGVMYDKIKLSRSNLRIGEMNFNTLIENIATWQRQLKLLVSEHNQVVTTMTGFDELSNRVIQLEKAILKERTKSRALFDELEHPMNVHRWRILESSDPKRYEKILQIQSLQKQIIAKADDVTRCVHYSFTHFLF